MPGLDGTGPNGLGPMTGGGFGRCNSEGFSKQGCGRGRGRKGVGNYRKSNLQLVQSNSSSEMSEEKYDVLRQQNEALESQLANAQQETIELANKIEELNATIAKMQSRPHKSKAKEN